MLYVFVNREQDKVYYTTYDENRADEYRMFHKVKLVATLVTAFVMWCVIKALELLLK